MTDFNTGETGYDDNIGDENVYSSEGRERLVEDEEMSSSEDAFMQGYEAAYD